MTPSDPWKKSVCCAARSDIGLRRGNNQDSFLVREAVTPRQWLDHGHLFIVADGMGAHVAGEVASRLAAETIAKSYLNRRNEPIDQALVHAVYDAHDMIRNKSREDAYRDMGTTCDAFVMAPAGLFIAHVGDSRVYRLRGRTFEQLTFDHSLIWEVCLATGVSLDQPPNYIPKNQITRSLGPTEKLIVDLEGPIPIEMNDIYLACSDGLSGQVNDGEIGQILALFPPEIAAETLINIANLRGGPDNITMVIVQALKDEKESGEVDLEMVAPLWHWGLLAGTAAAGAGAAAALFGGQIPAGVILAAAATAAATAFFILTRKTLFAGSPFLWSSAPSGKAPYRSWECIFTGEFAHALAKILREIFQATGGQPSLSAAQETAKKYEKEAVLSCQKRNYAAAILNYARAINYLMRELKKQTGT
ncbi:MAG: protein phosphatase 2C domain-containing protein [Planctomycetaceae bacterium]|jgi:protein phosphatase|nr:protein phosphatase 2C domain-containing protein [Planctomycetaceae bacterium]